VCHAVGAVDSADGAVDGTLAAKVAPAAGVAARATVSAVGGRYRAEAVAA
jgi:hypothetical protein